MEMDSYWWQNTNSHKECDAEEVISGCNVIFFKKINLCDQLNNISYEWHNDPTA